MATDPSETASDPAGGAGRPRPRRLIWILGAVAAAIVVLFGTVLIYANFINDPEDALEVSDLEAALDTETSAAETSAPETSAAETSAPETSVPETSAVPTTVADAGVEGVWVATTESEVGYRVTEVLFGVNTEGVGRTNAVTGELSIGGTVIDSATFSVEMASVASDDSRRDGQFRGRIMDVATYPTADFVLTAPIDLGAIPAPGEQVTATASGDLTLRGVTNPVTFEVTAQRSADRIGVLGSIPVVFADYGVPNPSIAGITTEDNGLLEFVLVFSRP